MTDSLPINLAHAETLSRPAATGPNDETQKLTRALVKGDEEAYRCFFDNYARRLLVYHIVLTNGQEHIAKELLQQTMIRVAKYIRVFPTEESLWSWLTTLARSCWIDEYRKKSRYSSFLEFFRRTRALFEPDANELEKDPCAELLETLEPAERELLIQKYVEGRTVRELAVARQTTEKALESSLSRARQKLKGKFSK